MRKKILIITLVNILFLSFAQSGPGTGTGEVGEGQPTILNDTEKKLFPASPAVNNLMKFEEVPVSYYTGIPDITIPLASISSSNSNFKMTASLKYHPLNAKPADKAGETGLGWSLVAGGTISRTVRNSVDELSVSYGTSGAPSSKRGIYRHDNITNQILNSQATADDEYTYEAIKGQLDTEYDLYQYNFMGNTGRFIVIKNAQGKLEVVKLDKSSLKILCNINIDGTEISGIRPFSFQIIDDQGIKYIFDVVEESNKNPVTIKIGVMQGQHIDWKKSNFVYNSAFHLGKVYDQRNVTLAELKYDTKTITYDAEPVKTVRTIPDGYVYSHQAPPSMITFNPDANFPGMLEIAKEYNSVNVKQLREINLTGKGFIRFGYEIGRLDTNYFYANNMYKLTSVSTGYYNDLSSSQYTIRDRFELVYGYTETTFKYPMFPLESITYKKLLLDKVVKKKKDDTKMFDYVLEYYNPTEPLNSDPWGFYKGNASESIATDVLKSVKLPTGGKNVFKYEENSYSYRPYTVEDGNAELVEDLGTILYGGGLRIREIGYYKEASADPNTADPEKKYTYDYKNLDEPSKSSGALVFPEPIFNYNQQFNYSNVYAASYNKTPTVDFSASYDVTTNKNILPIEKTQGSDVGYEYVTVSEDNKGMSNGRTEYKFRSPKNYPNSEPLHLANPEYPAIPYNHEEYKRGQMVSKKQYDSNDNLLTESQLNYEIFDFTIKSMHINSFKVNDVYANYYAVDGYSAFVSRFGSGLVNLLGNVYLFYNKYGYSQLSSRTDTSYFYNTGTPVSTQSTTTYEYNANDYPINVIQSFADGTNMTSITAYATEADAYNSELVNANMVGIPLLSESLKDNTSVSKTRTYYEDLLPKEIKTYPFPISTSTPIKEISFDHYDERGNLIQYTSKENLGVAVIWGYNKTLPIAKVVGATHAQVSSLAESMVASSNADALADDSQAGSTEASLLNLQKAFRNALPNHQVTTYTYDPLIGVTSITQPNGLQEFYIYSELTSELEKIVDSEGKIIKHFKYNYKN